LLSVVREIAVAEGIPAGQAAEHLDIVIRAIDDVTHRQARLQFVRAVPELEGLYELRDRLEAEPLEMRPPSRAPNDLAEGVAGARNSLSSGNPTLLAHRHSVARTDDPHGDSKLSSARGLLQERDDDTLAAGRPGSRRPVSSSH
jgi:hypothetical protein